MTDVNRHTEDRQALPWQTYHGNVFRLQKRIYQASQSGDIKRMRRLQCLLLCSWSARCLAVRQVTQDNRGKRSAGVDGVSFLKPQQRLALAENLRTLPDKASAVRRVYIPKPNGEERPLGIPIKPSKTQITHTITEHEGKIGFDFLGFHVRQFWVGKYRTRSFRGKVGSKTCMKPSRESQVRHLRQIKHIVRRHRGSNQAALIAELNPVIRGWCSYFSTVVSKRIFSRTEKEMIRMVIKWGRWRHQKKNRKWLERKYWIRDKGRLVFSDGKKHTYPSPGPDYQTTPEGD